eukprot:359365-Chlamydomonas_euryale.AAC.4
MAVRRAFDEPGASGASSEADLRAASDRKRILGPKTGLVPECRILCIPHGHEAGDRTMAAGSQQLTAAAITCCVHPQSGPSSTVAARARPVARCTRGVCQDAPSPALQGGGRDARFDECANRQPHSQQG